MEKIKSRWRKTYLEGDNNDDTNASKSSLGSNSNNIINNIRSSNRSSSGAILNASGIGDYHDNNSNSNDQDGNNHHHSHHHNHHHSNHNHNHHHNHHHGTTTNNNASNHLNNTNNSNNSQTNHNHHNSANNHHHHHHHSSKHSTPPQYEHLDENLYLDRRKNDHSRSRKDARSMVCDCILTREERARGVMGCLDDCLNRMLMIECGPRCTLGDHCLNKRFQKSQSAKVEVFKTRKKGWGLRACTDLPANSFIMEYVGEVVRAKEFKSRVKKYTKQKIKHHYFMALRSDEIIDATVKGNATRFINHSCEPNCETQKWTVDGELRIGFFTLRNLNAGEEITFDYQFQRYGRKAQKCYCEAPSCRGHIGGNDQTFSLNGSSSPQSLDENKSLKKAYKHGLLVDVTLEDKINALVEAASMGLKTRDQVLALARLSVRTEELKDRKRLLDVIKATKSEISLRLFVDYHGLEIICLWMRDPRADCDFRATIIDILDKLPIPNKTKVEESNVYRMIERWATEEPKQPSLESKSSESSVVVVNDNKGNIKTQNNDESMDIDKITNPADKIEKLKSELLNENSNSQIEPPHTPTSQEPTSQDSNVKKLPDENSNILNSPNIKALACKLLKKFQALNPGFKIPRLSRLQRMEIEKRMEEEVKNDSTSNDKSTLEQQQQQKNPFANRNYFKLATTNGLVKDSTTTPTTTKTDSLPVKRRFDPTSTNNIDLTPAPKISREEHRQQFEMYARLKDYYDAIEKIYGPTAAYLTMNGPHLNGPPPPYSHVAGTQNYPYLAAAAAAAAAATNPLAPTAISPQVLVNQQTLSSQTLPTPQTVQPATHAAQQASSILSANYLIYSGLQSESQYPKPQPPPQPTATTHPQPLVTASLVQTSNESSVVQATPPSTSTIHSISSSSDAQPQQKQQHQLVELTKPKPTNIPTLIVLANQNQQQSTDSALVPMVDDELAFSLCDYDEYYSNRDRSLNIEDVKDKSFPYPGSYYTTPSGENWFATVTLDRKTQQPRSVILNLQTRSEANNVVSNKKMFERGVSKFIKDALSEYYKPTCQVARITSKEDFVFLARKLTLAVLEKEQSRKGCERLECNKQVQRKVEDFVRVYMAKFGKLYTRHNKA